MESGELCEKDGARSRFGDRIKGDSTSLNCSEQAISVCATFSTSTIVSEFMTATMTKKIIRDELNSGGQRWPVCRPPWSNKGTTQLTAVGKHKRVLLAASRCPMIDLMSLAA